MTAQAVLTAATATTSHERQAIVNALRSNPFAQMIGQSWLGARLLIEVNDGEDLEATVEMIRRRVSNYVTYRRYA